MAVMVDEFDALYYAVESGSSFFQTVHFTALTMDCSVWDLHTVKLGNVLSGHFQNFCTPAELWLLAG